MSNFANASVPGSNVWYMVKDSFKMLEQEEQREWVKGHFQSCGIWSYFSRVPDMASHQLTSGRIWKDISQQNWEVGTPLSPVLLLSHGQRFRLGILQWKNIVLCPGLPSTGQTYGFPRMILNSLGGIWQSNKCLTSQQKSYSWRNF